MFNLALLLQRKNQHTEAADYWRCYLVAIANRNGPRGPADAAQARHQVNDLRRHRRSGLSNTITFDTNAFASRLCVSPNRRAIAEKSSPI
jgi:hypothetical protein